ncbi:hypothetical protein SARC_04433 [Sphaeroforma arctica JP610]|uniref:Uncharacterized protein n=1 Tax=Sphaeroforma arctica JP610 TaxID=667725 RepID=A0A0L0G4W2_9EUKA|nr:hypothetical protein SARC_04433 [Sphaeroforma arctica JP610]KNC83308.1 hypothetical protein SARC_04433 [Sphaeroforma arctica JP610]|eukprot:XP_014157210.1 hypothetical protein SARC_04433 [Sphaeroforma arctica JP610]
MAGIENDCNHANMDQSDPVEDCHMSRCEIKPGDCTEIQTPEICDDSAVLGSGDTKMAINNTPEVDTTVDVEVLKKNEHEATHDPLEVEAILICSSNDIQVDINSDVHVHTISDTRVGSPTSVSEAKNTDIVNNGNLQAVDGIDLVGGADYTVTTGVTGLDSGTEGSVYRDDLLCKFSVEHTEDSVSLYMILMK